MGRPISWESALLGDAVVPVAPASTRDIANSIDATTSDELLLLFKSTGGTSPGVGFDVYVWDGAAYRKLDADYYLDADAANLSLGGGVYYAIYSSAGVQGAPTSWSVEAGLRPA